MDTLVKVGNKGWECPECGAFSETVEEFNHRAGCSDHPNNIALNNLAEHRAKGGDTKTFNQDSPQAEPDPVDWHKLAGVPYIPSPPRTKFVGEAEIKLSSRSMQQAMKMFLEQQFNLCNIVVDKITGNNAKGFTIKFVGGGE